MNQIVNLSAPTHVELTITERCNHKCHHCYNPYRFHGEVQQSITKSQADIIIQRLYECGIGYVTLTGGEPLMEKEMMLYLVRRLREINIGVGLNSNLSLMTKKTIEELKNAGFENTILTSLPGFTPQDCDGITQVEGSFMRIVRGIRICRSAGIRICINTVFTQQNLHKGDDLLRFLKHYPVDSVAITKVVPPCYQSDISDYVFSKQDVQLLVDLMQKISKETACSVTSLCAIPWCLIKDWNQISGLSTKCAAGIVACSVDAITGAVTPCAHNEKSFGNIYNEPLEAIWKRMSLFRDPANLPLACQNCAILHKCGGECRLTASRVTKPVYELSCIEQSITDNAKHSTPSVTLKSTQVFRIPPFVRIREEKFGGTLTLGNHEIYVKSGLYRLFRMLKEREMFTGTELEAMVEMNDAVLKIFQILINQGFIEVVNQ